MQAIVYNDDELWALLENTNEPKWQSEDLRTTLKDRLPMSRENYIATKKSINEELENPQTELGINKDGFQRRVVAER